MLELQNISKAYGDRTVLSDISLSIEKGEIVSILGPSGCGKTTVGRTLLRLYQPAAFSLTGSTSRTFRWKSAASTSSSRIMRSFRI